MDLMRGVVGGAGTVSFLHLCPSSHSTPGNSLQTDRSDRHPSAGRLRRPPSRRCQPGQSIQGRCLAPSLPAVELRPQLLVVARAGWMGGAVVGRDAVDQQQGGFGAGGHQHIAVGPANDAVAQVVRHHGAVHRFLAAAVGIVSPTSAPVFIRSRPRAPRRRNAAPAPSGSAPASAPAWQAPTGPPRTLAFHYSPTASMPKTPTRSSAIT